MNIVDNILFQCRLNPPAAALIAPGYPLSKVSYGRLGQFIRNAARKARALGLAPGDVAALAVNDPVLHVAITLGFAHEGIATLPVRAPDIPADPTVAALITDGAPPQGARRAVSVDAGWIMGEGAPVPEDNGPAEDRGDDTCRVVVARSTAGSSPAIGLSHDLLARRIARHATIFGARLPQCARTFCDLGLGSSLGFQFLVYTLWRGGTFVFPGVDAAGTLQALDAYRVQNVVSGPDRLAQLVRIYEGKPSLQSNLETILSCGGILPRALAERLRARMCAQLMGAYGWCETSMIAGAPAHMLPDGPGMAGFVMPGVSVEIVDAGGKALPAGQDGHVRVRSPFSVAGYLGAADAPDAAFRDGWFYPGVIGRVTAEQMLMISDSNHAEDASP